MIKSSPIAAFTAALAVLAGSLVGVALTPPSPAEALPSSDLTVSIVQPDAGDTVLAGDHAFYDITASNALTGVDSFNLGFSLVVPAGLGFVTSALGSPTIYPRATPLPGDPTVTAGTQLWVWEDAADLPKGAKYTFRLEADPAQPVMGTGITQNPLFFPVGRAFDIVATAHTSSDATYLPVFPGSTGVGGASAIGATLDSVSKTKTTTMTAIKLTKTQVTHPENEILRGVHDQEAVYELKIETTKEGDIDPATVVDYLPAGLEFLSCGAADNTGGATVEYPTAQRLDATSTVLTALPATSGANNETRSGCLTPTTVETVMVTAGQLPAGVTDAGVYTKVTWHPDILQAGSTTTLRYYAAVPLFQNTMDWNGTATPGNGTEPAITGAQASNLDNNNGQSTRHGDNGSFTTGPNPSQDDGDYWTNAARASGNYLGVAWATPATEAAARAVFDDDAETISALDLRIVKSASSGSFVTGGVKTFTLDLATGEYASASAMTISDTVQDGLCIVGPVGFTNYVVDGGVGTYPAECTTTHHNITGADFTEIRFFPSTGEFTAKMAPSSPSTFVKDFNHAVTYGVLMRPTYQSAPPVVGPTTSGDSFDNTADIIGTTTLESDVKTVVAAAGYQANDEDVWDNSHAHVDSEFTNIDKKVLTRDAVQTAGDPCAVASGSADWVQGTPATTIPAGFQVGDTVCYLLTVTYPSSIATRNPIVSDFLPAGQTYVANNVITGPVGSFTQSGSRLAWKLGAPDVSDPSTNLYMQPGATSEIRVQAVIGAPATGSTPDKPQNLMKYRQESVDGAVFFLRDAAAIERDPVPSLTKGVVSINGTTVNVGGVLGTTFDSNLDHIQATEGNTVRFRIDLTGITEPVTNAEVWDKLPDGVPCASISSTTAFTCADNFFGTQGKVVWTGVAIAAGGQTTILYDMNLNSVVSVGTELDNTASVTKFSLTPNSSTTPVVYYPTGSLDTTTPSTGPTGVPGTKLTDPSSVFLKEVSVGKSYTSPTTDNTNGQAAVGELITYSYSATIPAGTTVHNGRLYDDLPTGLTRYLPYIETATFDNGNGTVSSTLPTGVAFDSATGELTIAPSGAYDNTTIYDQVFTVTVQAYINTTNASTNVTNTARFSSTLTSDPASGLLPEQHKDATITAVKPVLTVVKKVEGVDNFNADLDQGVLNYTVTVKNTGNSTAWDFPVTDVLPAAIHSVTNVSNSGTYDSATNTITWTAANLGNSLAAGSSIALTYKATLDPALLTGTAALVNTATVGTYHSLPVADPLGTTYTGPNDTASVTPQFPNIGITKTTTDDLAYIGANKTFTVTVSNTGGGKAKNVAVVDTLPAGFTFVSSTTAGAIYDPATQKITWPSIATIAAGGNVTITYIAAPLPLGAGAGQFPWDAANTGSGIARTNSVTATAKDAAGAGSPPGGSPYTATTTKTVHVDQVNFEIVKTHSGGAIAGKAGDLVWKLAVKNVGPDLPVGAVTVTDTLPAHTTLVSGTNTGWTFTNTAGALKWVYTGAAVPVGTQYPDILISTTIDPDILAGVHIDNVDAHVGLAGTPQTFEPDLSLNDATDFAVVVEDADLQVVKSITTATYVAGTDYTWHIDVKNVGSSTALNVKVVDTLPAGIGTSSITGTNWTCGAVVTGTITCTYALSLAPGASAPQLTVITHVLSSTTANLTNKADVTTTTGETVTTNNTSSVIANNPSAITDLTVVKTLDSATLTAGLTATYKFVVTSAGPSDAAGITITDTLPAGLTFAGNTTPSADWTCGVPDAVGHPQDVLCSLVAPSLAPGSSTVTFDVTVASSVTGSVSNTAVVHTTTPETDSTNNTSTVVTPSTVVTSATIDKTTTAVLVQGGDSYTYGLSVKNTGTADIKSVVATDPISAALSVTSVTLAPAATLGDPEWVNPCVIVGADADGFGGSITCTLDNPLVAGATAPLITLTVKVKQTIAQNTIDNTATSAWTDLVGTAGPGATDSVATPVKWIAYAGASECLADVPWFNYTVTTSTTVDTTVLPVTINWYKDANGNGIPEDPTSRETDPIVDVPGAAPVAVYTIGANSATLTTNDGKAYPVTVSTGSSGRTLSGRALWPGASVDKNGIGSQIPGYRIALPGETPTFENLIYDPTLYGANLLAGALISVKAGTVYTDVKQVAPADTAACAAARVSALTLSKTASVDNAGPGDAFSYVLNATNSGLGAASNVRIKDQIPSQLRVTKVTAKKPVVPQIPAWGECVTSKQSADGYGGVVECTLTGLLGGGQTTPDIVIDVKLSAAGSNSKVINSAAVFWSDPATPDTTSTAISAAAVNTSILASTGFDNLQATILIAIGFLGIGGMLMFIQRRRPRARHKN